MRANSDQIAQRQRRIARLLEEQQQDRLPNGKIAVGAPRRLNPDLQKDSCGTAAVVQVREAA